MIMIILVAGLIVHSNNGNNNDNDNDNDKLQVE